MKAGRTIAISLFALCLFLIVCAVKPQSSLGQNNSTLDGQTPGTGGEAANPNNTPCNIHFKVKPDDYFKNKEACDKYVQARGTIGPGPKDGWIATQMYGLAEGQTLKGSDIKVDVNNGVLTLRGTVNTAEQKAKASVIARDNISELKGDVKNNLEISRMGVTATSGANANTGTSTTTGSNTNAGSTGANTGTNGNHNVAGGGGSGGDETWMEFFGKLLYPLLITVAIVVLIAVLVYGLLYLRNKLKAAADAYFAAVRERQNRLAAESSKSIAELSNKIDARFTEQRETVVGLDRRLDTIRQEIETLRKTGAIQPPQRAYPGYQNPGYEVKVEEPAFPTSAEDYLMKMQRSALVVKPDFLNGILVKDPEGGGELVLVEDYSAPGGLLYVIPRVSNLGTKQDFHNYYEKYYDCYRPAAGEVWIKEPAVVDKVTGGWKLREKGEMEIR